jgi:isopentenyl-diphosphate delta-isomerase
MKAPKGSNEPLILVDESNRAVGAAPKLAIHEQGLLHRAFSIFMVDARGRTLLQKRNPRKYHSGGLWANSCCGHPRPGEQTVTAARRRLNEELGVRDPLRFGFFARYRAELDHGMQENELVYVYFGRLKSQTKPDPAEVADLEFLSLAELDRRIKREPGDFTYWMKHYIRHHHGEIARHIAAQSQREAS